MDNESELIWEAYSQRPRQQSLLDDILDILNDNEGNWDLDDTYIKAANELNFLRNQDDLDALKQAVKIYNREAQPLQDIDSSHLWELITGQGYRDEHDGYEDEESPSEGFASSKQEKTYTNLSAAGYEYDYTDSAGNIYLVSYQHSNPESRSGRRVLIIKANGAIESEE
jgi:hypothetical protein